MQDSICDRGRGRHSRLLLFKASKQNTFLLPTNFERRQRRKSLFILTTTEEDRLFGIRAGPPARRPLPLPFNPLWLEKYSPLNFPYLLGSH